MKTRSGLRPRTSEEILCLSQPLFRFSLPSTSLQTLYDPPPLSLTFSFRSVYAKSIAFFRLLS